MRERGAVAMSPASNSVLLVSESFSPWTIKAKWALDICQIRYAYREYTPLISEPWLRWRLGAWGGRVSVPVLIDGSRTIRDSWKIARYAARVGGKKELFGDIATARAWNDVSEKGLASARTRVVRDIAGSARALDESTPFLPPALRFVVRPVARSVVRALDRKYAHLAMPDAHRQALLALRAGLAEQGSGFLQKQFSYADMTMSVLLEAVLPTSSHGALGDAQRACWTDSQLAQEFGDLVAWRDGLFSAYKRL